MKIDLVLVGSTCISIYEICVVLIQFKFLGLTLIHIKKRISDKYGKFGICCLFYDYHV